MKTFLLFMVLFSFLQSTTLNINLVLVCLIARSLAVQYEENFWLAFFSGLILSFLTQTNLGYWPFILLLVVKIAHWLKSLPLSFNLMVIVMAGSLLIFLVSLLNSIFLGQQIRAITILVETILILPVFLLTKAWEERFDTKKGAIKLRV